MNDEPTRPLTSRQRQVLGVLAAADYVHSGQRNDLPYAFAYGTLNALRDRGYVAIEYIGEERIARITSEGRQALLAHQKASE